jgi:hypothetical protein
MQMSKLSTLTRNVESFIGVPQDLNKPLPWPKTDILKRLQRFTSEDIVAWHKVNFAWIQLTKCQPLLDLSNIVATSLENAVNTAELWIKLLKGEKVGPKNLPLTNRFMLSWTLMDILKALQAFQIVKLDASLRQCHILPMVTRYLRRTYELTLLLGQLLYPGNDCCWFYYSWLYIKETKLEDFDFDGREDYVQVPDPTLAGVLGDDEKMEDYYLPLFPSPPVFYRNKGPYGPAILRNYAAST